MNGISKFFTLFWCIYFPTCIAFNELPGFSVIDEIMTVVLLCFTFMKYNSPKQIVTYPQREFHFFLATLSFYVVYSLLFGENVYKAVFLDVVQQIRPFAIIYCTWILNPHFSNRQKKLMLTTMVVTLISWIIYHPESTAGMGAEFPVLGQLAICTGMSWYLFTEPSQKNKYFALAFVLSGLLAPKFKFMGEVVCFVYLVFFLRGKLNFKSAGTVASLSLLMTAVLFVTWTRFEAYYISGFDNENLARPMMYKTMLLVLSDYFPFGPGMGTFGTNAAAIYYPQLYYDYGLNTIWGLTPGIGNHGFIADSFYPTLAQFGVVGVVLFILFWKRRLKTFNEIEDIRYYKVAFMTFFCLAIEQTADSSWLSGKGMGYCMLIGLCLNANRNLAAEEDEEEDDEDEEEEASINSSDDGGEEVTERLALKS